MANRPPPAAARLCSTPSSGQASSVKRRRIRARTPDSRHSALPPRPENGLLVLLRLLPIPLSLASSSAISEEGMGGQASGPARQWRAGLPWRACRPCQNGEW